MELPGTKELSSTKQNIAIKKSINWQDFPWWFVGLVLVVIGTGYVIITQENFREAFGFIKAGISVTLTTTIFGFIFALVLGLLAGLSRISRSVFLRNLATFYVEFIRGIPMLVLIIFIALVGVPALVGLINQIGALLNNAGLTALAEPFTNMNIRDVPMNIRAIIALSVTYGAFLAEIFRAGIQSIDRGQMEASRSQGMSHWQAMRYVILPQAIRNVLPALGNDFVSMLKDSSLVSILAVRDITQVARLYSGHSFRYAETYTTLAILYLTLTVTLSLFVKSLERRYQNNVQS